MSILLLSSLWSCAGGKKSLEPLKTVPEVDLDRYTGLWYQVARYPHFFQRSRCALSTAEYTRREDGKIQVENRCWAEEVGGKITQKVSAVARPVKGEPGHLKVTFYGLFTSDYLIIDLDTENYQWAVVSTPSRKTLWILSREPALEEEVFQKRLQTLEKKGFDRGKILRTSRQ